MQKAQNSSYLNKIRKTIEICVPVPFFHWPFCVKAASSNEKFGHNFIYFEFIAKSDV